MGGMGPLMNGPAISAIDGWAGPTIFSGPLINGSRMGRIDVWVRTLYIISSMSFLNQQNLPFIITLKIYS